MGISKEDLNDMKTGEQFVKFVAGKPKTLHFLEWNKVTQDFIDEATGKTKKVPSVVCVINNEDGEDVSKVLTITSKRLISELSSLLLMNKPFTAEITQFGAGFNTEYEVKEM